MHCAADRAGHCEPLMNRLFALIAAALAASLLAGAAHAQIMLQDADPTDRSSVVDELVVSARPNGPAMWRVHKGDSEVIILGSIQPLPHQPPWDTRRMESLMEGARQVLLPPSGRVGGLQAVSMSLSTGKLKLPRGQRVDQVLSPQLRARYLETVSLFGMDERRYESWKPGAAGFLMLSDYREKVGLSTAKPGSTIERMAKARRIPVRIVGSGSVGQMFNGAKGLSDAQHQRCLALALDEIDREADYARPVAAAWAVGDIEAVRRAYPAPVLEACLLEVPSYRRLIDSGVTEATGLINEALAQPGKTIAVMDLNFLIRRGGVLDRMKAQGAEITAPRGARDGE
jgi:uncharacterized protein YbaP (TraB family)